MRQSLLIAAVLVLPLLADAEAGRWKKAGSLRQTRIGMRATALDDGRVLVSGGMGPYEATAGQPTRSVIADGTGCEIWDPAKDRWTAAGALTVARLDHAATLLADGRVLVAGG